MLGRLREEDEKTNYRSNRKFANHINNQRTSTLRKCSTLSQNTNNPIKKQRDISLKLYRCQIST